MAEREKILEVGIDKIYENIFLSYSDMHKWGCYHVYQQKNTLLGEVFCHIVHTVCIYVWTTDRIS